MRNLFEEVDLPRITVTLNAGNTNCKTPLVLREQQGTDKLAMIKARGGLASEEIAWDGNRGWDGRTSFLGTPDSRELEPSVAGSVVGQRPQPNLDGARPGE